MPAAEDRQAKALEEISRNTKELVRVMAALNDNILALAKIFQKAVKEIAEADVNQMQLDIEKNQVVHTSEFNTPQHRPTTVHFEEGVK